MAVIRILNWECQSSSSGRECLAWGLFLFCVVYFAILTFCRHLVSQFLFFFLLWLWNLSGLLLVGSIHSLEAWICVVVRTLIVGFDDDWGVGQRAPPRSELDRSPSLLEALRRRLMFGHMPKVPCRYAILKTPSHLREAGIDHRLEGHVYTGLMS